MKRLEINKHSGNLSILKGLLSLLAGEVLTKTFPSIVQALEIMFLRFLLASFNSVYTYMPFEQAMKAADDTEKNNRERGVPQFCLLLVKFSFLFVSDKFDDYRLQLPSLDDARF